MSTDNSPTQGRLLDTYAARAGLRTGVALAEAVGAHPNSARLWLTDARRIPADVLARCREVLVLDADEVAALLDAGERVAAKPAGGGQ